MCSFIIVYTITGKCFQDDTPLLKFRPASMTNVETFHSSGDDKSMGRLRFSPKKSAISHDSDNRFLELSTPIAS